jgi:hypothetical protein
MEEVYRKKMENVHQEMLDMEYGINCKLLEGRDKENS